MRPPFSALAAVSLLVLGVSPGPTRLVANEPPKNTAAIDSLTPEQARKLVKQSAGVTIDVQVRSKPSQEFHQLQNTLPLNGLKLLDADTAKELAKHANGSLLLNGLKTLSADATAALAKYKGERLELSGLTALDADIAKWLAAMNVNALDLDGLTTLRADAATALAEAKAHTLSLDGLTTLDAQAARALADFRGHTLFLNGLTTLEARAAKPLAGFKGRELSLNSLTAIDTDAATALATFKGELLYLAGLTTLDAAAVKAFSQCRERVFLPEQAMTEFLARNPLNHETAQLHVTFSGGSLPGVNALDVDTARALVPIETWDGHLPELTAFESPDSVAVAEVLATRTGPLSLPNLKKISPKTLTALIEKEDVRLPPIETLELIPEPDGTPTDDFVIPDEFAERQRQQQDE